MIVMAGSTDRLPLLLLNLRPSIFQRDCAIQDRFAGLGVGVEGEIAEALGLPDLSPGLPPGTSAIGQTYCMPNLALKTGFTHHPLGLARLEIP